MTEEYTHDSATCPDCQTGGGIRIHLRHIGSGPMRRPGISRGNFRGCRRFANIYLGGRYFIAIRPSETRDPLIRQLLGQGKRAGFWDVGMGRVMLQYKREEDACPWPAMEHYYGLCFCENKRPLHPRYMMDPDEA